MALPPMLNRNPTTPPQLLTILTIQTILSLPCSLTVTVPPPTDVPDEGGDQDSPPPFTSIPLFDRYSIHDKTLPGLTTMSFDVDSLTVTGPDLEDVLTNLLHQETSLHIPCLITNKPNTSTRFTLDANEDESFFPKANHRPVPCVPLERYKNVELFTLRNSNLEFHFMMYYVNPGPHSVPKNCYFSQIQLAVVIACLNGAKRQSLFGQAHAWTNEDGTSTHCSARYKSSILAISSHLARLPDFEAKHLGKDTYPEQDQLFGSLPGPAAQAFVEGFQLCLQELAYAEWDRWNHPYHDIRMHGTAPFKKKDQVTIKRSLSSAAKLLLDNCLYHAQAVGTKCIWNPMHSQHHAFHTDDLSVANTNKAIQVGIAKTTDLLKQRVLRDASPTQTKVLVEVEIGVQFHSEHEELTYLPDSNQAASYLHQLLAGSPSLLEPPTEEELSDFDSKLLFFSILGLEIPDLKCPLLLNHFLRYQSAAPAIYDPSKQHPKPANKMSNLQWILMMNPPLLIRVVGTPPPMINRCHPQCPQTTWMKIVLVLLTKMNHPPSLWWNGNSWNPSTKI